MLDSMTPAQKAKILVWVTLATIAAVALAIALSDPLLGMIQP